MAITGRIHSVETFGTVDGPGVRYIVFLQGCALRCKYCHNPDTWQRGGGTETNSEDLVKDIITYRSFIRSGGVTVSGGEPLLQPAFAQDIIERSKAAGFHTAIDTAGSVSLEISQAVIDAADLVLLDIKNIDDQQSWRLTGRGNGQTLATLDYCEEIGKPVWVRHVLLPGWTLQEEQLTRLATYLAPFNCIEQVELLPFHKMGEYKWKELGYSYSLTTISEPSRKDVKATRAIFEAQGLKVLIQGEEDTSASQKIS